MEKPCEQCEKIFKFKPSRANRARFCSKKCLGIFNANRLHTTRNEWAPYVKPFVRVPKGVRVSPKTEFKPGQRPANYLSVGSVTIRIDKNGKQRAYIKVSDPNVWKLRAVVIYESIHGPLLKNYLVHHCDRDTLNDAPDNLEAMTRSKHLKEHRDDYDENRLVNLRKASIKRKDEGRYYGRPKNQKG